MATNIYNFNGTLLTTIADGTIDTTHSTLKFPGKGYQNYGEPVLEDILWTTTNFAGSNVPALPLTGQTWFNTNTNVLSIFNGTIWQSVGGVLVAATPPSTGSNVGAFWFDSVNLQLYIWDGVKWDLIGPLGSAVNGDPVTNTVIPTFSQIDSSKLSDGYLTHQVWRITIGGILFAIISKDASFVPVPSISGFAKIQPGINFNTNIIGIGIYGDPTLFKSTQTNLPITDNTFSMGSPTQRFAGQYAVNGSFGNTLAVGNISSGGFSFQVTGSSNFNGPIALGSGTTSVPPLIFSTGSLTTTPSLGAMEFDGQTLYISVNKGGTVVRENILMDTSNVQVDFNSHLPNCVLPLVQTDVIVNGWIDRTFSLPNIRQRLPNATLFYVSMAGSDTTGDGSYANPWLTIQHAIDIIPADYDSAGNDVTIQCLGSGTDPGFTVRGPLFGGGVLQVVGSNLTPPFNWTIQNPAGQCVETLNAASVYVSGFKLVSPLGTAIAALESSTVVTGALEFGETLYLQISAFSKALVIIATDYWITGSGQSHLYASAGGQISGYTTYPIIVSQTCTVTGTPNFWDGFAQANNTGILTVQTVTYNGAGTGHSCVVTSMSMVQTGGRLTPSPFFPGDGEIITDSTSHYF